MNNHEAIFSMKKKIGKTHSSAKLAFSCDLRADHEGEEGMLWRNYCRQHGPKLRVHSVHFHDQK